MSIFRDFFVKEKPVFTGISRGVGGFSFGAAAGDSSIPQTGTQANPFTLIANAYAAGVSNGLHYFQNANVNSGTAFQMRYATYDNRGWVEMLFSQENDRGTPWDHWLDYQGGTRPYLVNYNLSNGGLNYSSGDSSVIKLHTDFNIVDVAFTSKSAKGNNGIAATGQNQQSALPLVASSDLAGTQASQARQAIADFFEGLGSGISIGGNQGGTPTEDYAAYWSKTGNGVTGPFEMHLGFREGIKSTEEFHIADGNTSPGSTFAPNIGYRDVVDSYGGANVGSWASSSVAKDVQYTIDSGNVLSIWISDSLT